MQVNHKELEKFLKVAYKTRLPVYIWGTMGIGKSESVRRVAQQIAKELKLTFLDGEADGEEKFGFIDVRVSQLEPSDLRGLPIMNGGITKWLPPSWLPSNEKSKGILFLDELNLAVPSIHASCYQLIHDRRIGDYKLPDGWIVISAGNTISDKANVFELPAPLLNRFVHVELRIPTAKEFIDYALKHDFDSSIISFLEFKPTYIYKFDKNNKDKSFPTPRSISFASRLVQENDCGLEEKEVLISSAVGEAFATEFIAFLKLQNKIDIKSILEKPELVKDIQGIDLKYSLLGMVLEQYRQDRKVLEKCLALTNYLEAEYGILLLRFLNNGRREFKEDVVKLKSWKDISIKYGKYLLDLKD